MNTIHKYYFLLQFRQGFYVYSVVIFTIDFIAFQVGNHLAITSVFIPLFFYKKFVYPIRSLELPNHLVLISGVRMAKMLRLHNLSFIAWFYSGILVSLLARFLLSQAFDFQYTVSSICIILLGILTGNSLYILRGGFPHFQKNDPTSIVLFILTITLLSPVILLLANLDTRYLLFLAVGQSLMLWLQTSENKRFLWSK